MINPRKGLVLQVSIGRALVWWSVFWMEGPKVAVGAFGLCVGIPTRITALMSSTQCLEEAINSPEMQGTNSRRPVMSMVFPK